MNCKHFVCASAAIAVFITLGSKPCFADAFVQTNLVSDVPGMANVTDPNLKNPWGVAFSPGSPFWTSNQGSGTSTLYDGVSCDAN